MNAAPNFKSTQEKLNEMYRSVTAIAGEYASQAEYAWALLQQAEIEELVADGDWRAE